MLYIDFNLYRVINKDQTESKKKNREVTLRCSDEDVTPQIMMLSNNGVIETKLTQ
jgi:hypothetical protein